LKQTKKMTGTVITQEIIRQVGKLPYESQQRVLGFAQALAVHSPKGVEGKHLVRFAGSIRSGDLKAMSKAIEAGCEKIDADEW